MGRRFIPGIFAWIVGGLALIALALELLGILSWDWAVNSGTYIWAMIYGVLILLSIY